MSALRITSIDFHKLFVPLKEPFVISLGPIHNAENAVVIIHTDQGITGYGECSPFMTINGESADTGLVVGEYFKKVLIGRDALDIAGNVAAMDAVIYGNASIKSAFDMALYDIASQHAGVPLWKFLNGDITKPIVTDYTVSIGEPTAMATEAVRIQKAGFPAIKVKLGKHGPTDVKRMQAIREAVGPEIPLRIDANQGWSVDEAIETLNALAPLNIEHCEEPIARWAYTELPKVKAASPIAIMADESLGDHHDADRLIALDACSYLNIKLGKSGGIFKALEIVKSAEKVNMHLQVGAFMESRLAMTAFAHFSLCSPLIQHFDFDTALMFSEDPVTGGMVYGENGRITLPDAPGIGATIDKAWFS